ncbi:MAG: 2-C-methyl-D-erythritol 2,4-cyclodiphosphate synthase [Actinomycetota bacterium]
MTYRIGHGFDLHRFSDESDRPLMLGGIFIPDHRGLTGHSDADAVIHALCDALLGAAGLGDLGTHFPESDPTFKDADSTVLLREVVSLIHGHGWKIANADVTVLAETPKLAPHRRDMEEKLSSITRAPISIKATTMERLGPIGEGLALAAEAVALLQNGHP